ncbi:hypothetical protein [uncultured Rothia sp.]|mgnify:FL=1|uniref:hypothetical protein n=1 Tax=uncultured Rothia sp. TaxID=316088 RepID=UPI00321686F0
MIGNDSAGNTTATLSNLTFTLAIPKGMAQGLTVNSSSWTLSGPTSPATIATKTGAVDTSNMDVYTLRFNGSLTNPVVGENSTASWPGSTFTLLASSGSYCCSSATIYAGYSFDNGSLANGQASWSSYTNVQNATING